MSLALNALRSHEKFVNGQTGGCRAFFRFQSLPELQAIRRKLDGIEFIGCNLQDSSFAVSSLKTASFYCSNLRNSDLRGADLSRADLRGAVLRGADLYRANLDGADFRKAVLFKDERSKEFEQFDWIDDDPSQNYDGSVDFRDCALRGARLNAAKLKGSNFSGAILEGATFSQADLRGANFDNAILTGADLKGANLLDASMNNVLKSPTEEAMGRAAKIETAVAASDLYTRTQGKQGARAELEGEDLRVKPQLFAGKGLIGANLRGVVAAGLDFSGASLVGAIFSGSDLRGANFTGAILRGVNFRDCNLNHAIFAKADLHAFKGASGREFVPCFDGAALNAAHFEDAIFDDGFDVSHLISSQDSDGAADQTEEKHA